MPRVRELVGEHLEFWQERHLCTVTTLRGDGSPHVVPMGIVVDASRGVAWGITSRTSQKAANLRAGTDPRVAVCQVDGRRWTTLEGTAVVRDDAGAVRDAEARYAQRYRQPRENPLRVVLEISVDRILGNQ